VQVQRAVLEAEQPDFVVFSGDMASGWVCAQTKPACPPGWYEARWRQLIAPVRAAGIPYAIILGNHE
jgi:pre-mRNA-splicing factor SYF1